MPRPTRFSPEVRARAVRMVVEHEAAHESQWAAIISIAEKIGCTGVAGGFRNDLLATLLLLSSPVAAKPSRSRRRSASKRKGSL